LAHDYGIHKPQVYGSIQDTRVVIQIHGDAATVGKGGAVTTALFAGIAAGRGGEQVQIALGASTKSGSAAKLPLHRGSVGKS